jgi:glycosyl transferase, family 25
LIALVINLDRSPERLAAFAEQARAAGLAFERLPAVDGRQLSAAEQAQAVAPRFEFQPLNPGEIAIFMSQRAAWQRIVASGQPFGAVFEDDVVLAPATGRVLQAIASLAPAADLIKLETSGRPVVLTEPSWVLATGHGLRRLCSWHGGAAGYVVSRGAAQRLLQLTEPLADPVDQVLFNPLSRISASLTVLQAVPALCMQRNLLERQVEGSVFGTTIDRHKSRGLLWRHGPWTDLRRAWKRHLERRLRRRLARLPGHDLCAVDFDRAGADTAAGAGADTAACAGADGGAGSPQRTGGAA